MYMPEEGELRAEVGSKREQSSKVGSSLPRGPSLGSQIGESLRIKQVTSDSECAFLMLPWGRERGEESQG